MLPPPLFPGFDSLGALRHILATGHAHSWFVLNRTIALKEFALSGSEQNPDLTGKDVRLLAARLKPRSDTPLQRFLDHGVDFLQAGDPAGLAGQMNQLTGGQLIDPEALDQLIRARDRQFSSGLGKDPQLAAIRAARRFATDKIMRVAPPAPGSAARPPAGRPALGPHAQEPRRPAHGSAVAGPRCRRTARPRAVRRR
jgi:predicted oxidoreductase